MKFKLLAAVVLASALAGASFAEGGPASPSPSTNSNAAPAQTANAGRHKPGYDPDVQICKWTQQIGTRLGGGRTCMTRAQWDELERSGQEQLNDATHRSGEMGRAGG